jgi:hypothetical protein
MTDGGFKPPYIFAAACSRSRIWSRPGSNSEVTNSIRRSGPPMSPLTPSYFTTWAFFDVQFGASRETMGTTILRVAELTGLPKWILDVVGLMHQSRMGFYVNCGIKELSQNK